jgi:hypothetical protein
MLLPAASNNISSLIYGCTAPCIDAQAAKVIDARLPVQLTRNESRCPCFLFRSIASNTTACSM